LRSLQTDNAREFLCLKQVLDQHGIQHRLICPHTHEQNGVVERKPRHIVDMGLTLLATTSLPRRFWAEAFLTSTHIINVLPTPVLHNSNPYTMLFNKNPNYAIFKKFGCACFPLLRPYNKNKFDFRSQQCLFLGYSVNNKGYICLTPSGKTIISRHVHFNETEFPYHEQLNSFSISYVSMSSLVTTPPILTVIHSNTNTTMPIHSSSDILLIDNNTDMPNNIGSIGFEIQPINSHPKVTRAKVGTFKPKTYNAIVSIPTAPTSVKEAISSPMWFQAMNDEYHTLLSNKTWTLTTLPPGASLAGCKWIFKTKLHADGTFQRCKTRLVAKGFNQTECVDYTKTFSPVVKHNTIRIVLYHVVTQQWPMHQIDINNAFLHGGLIEHVYMQQPPGFAYRDSTLVYRLHKAIYGLKQAPRSWFSKLSQTLIHLGFQFTVSDSSVLTKFTTSYTLFVLVYVDDIIIISSSSTAVTDLISTLSSFFALKDLGPLHHFLGIQVSITQHGNMHLSQDQYIKHLLLRTNMLHAKSQPTPMASSTRLQQDSSEPFQDPSMYRSVVGVLQYILIT